MNMPLSYLNSFYKIAIDEWADEQARKQKEAEELEDELEDRLT